jgi:hypothetical protein
MHNHSFGHKVPQNNQKELQLRNRLHKRLYKQRAQNSTKEYQELQRNHKIESKKNNANRYYKQNIAKE